MQFTMNAQDLLDGLNTVTRALAARPAKQILEGVRQTNTPYYVEENRRRAIRWAMDHAEPEDIVVLCGKGHEDYQIIGTEKTHLDEREEVAAHLEELRLGK